MILYLVDVVLEEEGGDGLVGKEENGVHVPLPRLLLRVVDEVDQKFQNLEKSLFGKLLREFNATSYLVR